MSLIAELKRRNVFRVGTAYGIVGWLLLALIAVTAPARAQNIPGEVPLADVLEILVVDRELLAIDAAAAARRSPGCGWMRSFSGSALAAKSA